ncbi:MAG: RDD family protein [Chloroflexi bacterium]|nr:RDD family protein [Chloroflexota bacterium]
MEKVGFVPRFVAYIIDAIIVGIVVGIIGAVFGMLGSDTLVLLGSLVGFVVGFGYYVYFWGATGQTPGKSIMKIKIVPTDGSAMTIGKAVMRLIGYFVSIVFVYLGFLWILFDANKQGWHDKIAGTYVVKA